MPSPPKGDPAAGRRPAVRSGPHGARAAACGGTPGTNAGRRPAHRRPPVPRAMRSWPTGGGSTYAELDRRPTASRRPARARRAPRRPRRGRPAQRVDVVVAAYGALRAGAAFMLVHPASRRSGPRGCSPTPARSPSWPSSTAPRVRAAWARRSGGPLILAAASAPGAPARRARRQRPSGPSRARRRPGRDRLHVRLDRRPKGVTFLHRAICTSPRARSPATSG